MYLVGWFVDGFDVDFCNQRDIFDMMARILDCSMLMVEYSIDSNNYRIHQSQWVRKKTRVYCILSIYRFIKN